MNRLLTYPLLIWEFIGYMSIFTKQKQTSDLLPPAIGKLSIGPKSACRSANMTPFTIFFASNPFLLIFERPLIKPLSSDQTPPPTDSSLQEYKGRVGCRMTGWGC